MKSALLIVDVLNDFTDQNGSLYVKDGEKIVENIKKVITNGDFDCIVKIQDNHPKDHKSFASNHVNKNVFDVVDLNGIQQVLWTDHCVQNSWGSEIYPELKEFLDKLENGYYIFTKGEDSEVDSYSGFFDNDKKTSTGLGEFLVNQDITDVVVVGLATDYCVKFTCLDAFKFKFDVYLITDCIKAVNINSDDETKAIDEMEKSGVILLESSDIS